METGKQAGVSGKSGWLLAGQLQALLEIRCCSGAAWMEHSLPQLQGKNSYGGRRPAFEDESKLCTCTSDLPLLKPKLKYGQKQFPPGNLPLVLPDVPLLCRTTEWSLTCCFP